MRSKQATFAAITDIGVIPALRTSSVDSALKAIEAIYQGGIRAAEIIVTVPGAVGILEKVADRFGDQFILGAGTVLDADTAQACLLAGAEFIAAPCLKVATIEMAQRYSKVVFPGALTPTEVLTAWQAGADAVKIYPCSMVGGPKYIKALRAPFPHIEMIPNGGVTLETVGDFLRSGACAVGVGSELVDSVHLREGRFMVFEERARRFLEAISKTRGLMKASSAN
jgi:2-dehydro-3-deoxyphosphogluconate aldolase/(4S)-4-hydroxy-2-oxoglutarate aldolase